MESQTKTCQNCKANFVIEPDDFAFYEKVNVPAPTFCPDCRSQRRMTWRNERALYKRKTANSGKEVVSMFAPESEVVVYDRDHWWSDDWDQLATGREYDFNKSFFEQFKDLLSIAPLPNLANTNVVNSDYGNHNADLKNGYYTFASYLNENVHYSEGAVESKDSMDVYKVEKSEQLYEDVLCGTLNHVFYSYDTDDSLNSAFLLACANLIDCLGCVNLRNKSYHIFNERFTKEEYVAKLKEYGLDRYDNIEKFKEQYREFTLKYPRRHTAIIKATDCTGDNILNSKNAKQCFDVFADGQDIKFITHAMGIRDSYDAYGTGGNAELMYENVDCGLNTAHCKFTIYTHQCNFTTYAYACQSSSYLFGCVGLRNKKYCILNKQYTKEEYEALVPKIIQHMNEAPYKDAKGRVYAYGEFFPVELSPFVYNETIAQEYYPLTQEIAVKDGYQWKNVRERKYVATTEAKDLPQTIAEVSDAILSEVIGCAHGGSCNEQCTTAFRVIAQELQFYRKMNLPLPRLCPNCRHYQRLAQLNPLRLWKRQCMCDYEVYKNTVAHAHHESGRCSNEFETPYAPDRKEIIYCEKCYQAEVV